MTAPLEGLRLVTVAHGTRTTAGNLVAAELTAAAGERLGVEATTSYVELCEPLLTDVVATTDRPTVVVPLLLSTGYHLRHDLPGSVAAAQRPELVRLGGALGPDPLLASAQVDRLREAGATPGQPVVMVAAGSSDPLATDDLEAAAALLAAAWGAPVRLATLSALGTRPEHVVRPGDAVSPYLLATGHFHRKARHDSLAAGASVVADVIGPHPRLVDLVCARATALVGTGRGRLLAG
ncbi:sirohydrochlorin ferrochelatase [Nocardioides sp. J9]|uniref:sirohydrochlorin chelatase n=1 Tax=Nocardioides sp. J9 TaxID=935844 RepID=UPI0011AC0B6A|nr:CbiX/SirB N-terminal domain-containing protein [Nocardioides sp. J9]TWH02715.1 sirohydrochlorin ferrochelatase [Nocardioides sp. J9]